MDRSDEGPALKLTARSNRAGLDRLSRALEDVLPIMERVGGAGGGLHSLTENIGTTAPAALTMMMRRAGNLANFEYVMIWEPTFDEPRRARREALGRTPKAKPEQRANIAEKVMSGQYTAAQMARLYKVGGPTVSRLFAAHRPATEAEHVARR